jgi:hypothetical protein
MARQITPYQQPDPVAPHPPPFEILCLSGGGYRGLFTASILEELEQKAGKPLASCFDLIAGTSIGGILACGLAAEIEASVMREQLELLGSKVFDRHLDILGRRTIPIRFGWIGPRYGQRGLEAAIKGVLGTKADAKLASIGKPLIVPAVSATNGRAIVFESGVTAGDRAAVSLRDVALATSAAPTYFPDHDIDEESMVDGGLIANAPDMLAVIKAMSTAGRPASQIRLLSIGTSGAATGEVYRPGRSSGRVGWLARSIFDLTLAAQQDLSLALVEELLGAGNLRIDIRPEPNKGRKIGLDKVSDVSTSALKGLAAAALREATQKRGADLDTFLRHNA